MTGPRVAGKVVLVTGAGGGIGAGCAELLAAEGARVAVTDVRSDAAAATCQRIQAAGGEAVCLVADLRHESDCVRLVEQADAAYGRLDVLVNVAGVYPRATLTETSLELWHQILQVNLDAPFLLCRESVPRMIRCGGGSIVNIGSGHGLGGTADLMAYSVSKAGLLGLTRNLAAAFSQELIRANYVIPGWVLTDMERTLRSTQGQDDAWFESQKPRLPGKRFTEPLDVARAVVFLASDESQLINGAVLNIDGGLSILPSIRTNIAARLDGR
jgi:NAD(P)-dependent dehydrogenase (short-subunit alcohol dehydrogenase family)